MKPRRKVGFCQLSRNEQKTHTMHDTAEKLYIRLNALISVKFVPLNYYILGLALLQ